MLISKALRTQGAAARADARQARIRSVLVDGQEVLHQGADLLGARGRELLFLAWKNFQDTPPEKIFSALFTGDGLTVERGPRWVRTEDHQQLLEAIRTARDILNQPAFAPYNDGELSPGPKVETDDQILDWVRADAETALQPSCTAAMGVEEGSVVDPATMRVHGLEGLRVVDASVFPVIPGGNTNAPTIMVAERAADLVKGRVAAPTAKL